MTPQVFDALKEMSYGELLKEAEIQKDKLYNQDINVDHQDFSYYTAILQELDYRQSLGERLKF